MKNIINTKVIMLHVLLLDAVLIQYAFSCYIEYR